MSPRRRGRGRGTGVTAVAAVTEAAGAPLSDGNAIAGTNGNAASANGIHHSTSSGAPSGGAPSGGASSSGEPNGGAPSGGSRNNDVRSRRGPIPRAEASADREELSGGRASCTLAQMRRFIKSRPYVPVHELRRRFLIDGIEDEVSPMPTGQGTLYVGLPVQEAGYLGELVKAGEVGCELLLDPTSPAVVGVYPMRPIARQ
jgi:hypothetical protein